MSDSDDCTVLATVRRRGPVLTALGRAPVRTSALVDRLDLSRSTVDRALSDLVALDLVERREDGYRLTTAGTLVVEEYDDLLERIDVLAESSDLLAALPTDADVPPAVLDGADVVTAERHSPTLPVRALCDLLDESRFIRSFAPAIVPEQVACYRRNVVDGDAAADVALTDSVLERLRTDFREDLLAGLETDRLRLRRVGSDDALPFSLAVCDRPEGPAMGLLVYADRGVRGFVGTDDDAAVEWARRRLDGLREASTPLDAPGSAE
jgi:predicted transcriptional regulator